MTENVKKIAVSLLLLTLPLSAENLFNNSTMDTAGGWRGSKRMVKETEGGQENRLLQITASPRGSVSFSQEVPTRDIKDVKLTFRYRSKDYKGRGLELRGENPDGGFIYFKKDLVADGKWHEVNWTYSQIGSSKKIEFHFIVLDGEGEVFFDDVTAEGKP